jgi:hypothetical protein
VGAYEDYLDQVAYEDYLSQVNGGGSSGADSGQSSGVRAENRPRGTSPQIGPDYKSSIVGNVGLGLQQFVPGTIQMGKDAVEFAEHPIDTVEKAGAEKTLRTVGTMAGGIAGAGAFAPIGALWGTALGPIGTVAGGAIGGALGFGLGATGFNMATDAANQIVEDSQSAPDAGPSYNLRPLNEYAKDAAYTFGQSLPLTTLSESGAAGYKAYKALGESPINLAAKKLQALYPDLSPEAITQALNDAQGDPYAAYKSLGELLGNDSLKNAQRTMARSGGDAAAAPSLDGQPLDAMTPYERATSANRARDDAHLKGLDQIETSPTTIEDVQAAIQQGNAADIAAQQAVSDAAKSKVEGALNDIPAPIEPQEAGVPIRDAAAENKDAARGAISQKFESIGSGKVDTTPAMEVANAAASKYFKELGAQPNQELAQLLRDLAPVVEDTGLLDDHGNPITREVPRTMQDVQALRSKALEIASGADKRAAAVAGIISDSLLDVGENAVKSGAVTPEQASAWREGIALRRQMGVDFESSATPTKSILAKQPGNAEFRVPDSAVPAKFFRPGSKGVKEGLDNYKSTVGATEADLEPLQRYAAKSFRDYAVSEDGVVNSKKAGEWLRLHDTALKELPTLKQQLSNVDSAQRFLNETFGDLKRTKAEVETGALKLFLQADPEKAIPALLNGRNMVKRLNTVVQYLKGKDPDAIAGLRRGIIEHLKQKAFIADGKVSLDEAGLPTGPQFDGTVRGGLLKAEWEKLRPALERSKIFTESQMKGFDMIYRDQASQLSIEKAKMPGGSDTVQNASVLGALMRVSKNVFVKALPYSEYITGFVTKVLSKIPETQYQAALQEALLNPRYARDLLVKSNAKNFTRGAHIVFGDVIDAALKTPAGVTAANPAPQRPPKKEIPRVEKTTSRESFPHPEKILHPATPGKPQKTTLDLSSLSPETRARISVESGGNPDAVSPKGAQGLAQLMPDTGAEMAAQLGEEYNPIHPGMTLEERRASIDQNVRLGDRYYKQQLKEFKQPTLAWAAYNAGPQRVREAMALAGTSRDVNKILSNLPEGVQKETVPYVGRIRSRLGG